MNKRGTPRNLRPFKKGNPGGPGRPKAVWKEWLSQVEPEAQDVLRAILRDRRVKPETRARVAQDMLDRQHGRPRQDIEGSFDWPEKLIIHVNPSDVGPGTPGTKE